MLDHNKLNFSNWGVGTPHNVGLQNENFLMMYKSDGTWNDLKNYFAGGGNADRGFVVEFDTDGLCYITFNPDECENVPQNQLIPIDSVFTIPNQMPKRGGYKFIGWSSQKDETVAEFNISDTFTATGNITLYAVWEKMDYTIIYNAGNGSNAPMSQTKGYDIDVNISTETPVLDEYVFMGWTTEEASTVVEYLPGATYNTNEEVTLYAVWKLKSSITYTISYVLSSLYPPIEDQIKEYDGKVIIQDITTPRYITTGQSFAGWSSSSDALEAEYIPGDEYSGNADLQLYPVFNFGGVIYIPKIYFDANGGIDGPFVQSHKQGESFILTNEIPTKEGYVFSGWGTSENAVTAEYFPGEEYTYDTELRLFAVWTPEIQGVCSDTVSWYILDETLYFEGTDAIPDYEKGTAPWYAYRAGIKEIQISDGITEIGNYAFYGLSNISTQHVPQSINRIGEYAFSNCVSL